MKQSFTARRGALDGIEAFLSVARHLNFRKAATELAVTPSAVSQSVRLLESRLGVPLFVRTTRAVGLTEAGELYLARVKPAFEELIAASEAARGLGQRPRGLLRIAAPPSVVPILLEPLIASFNRAYPDIEIEIAAGGEAVDLAKGGFDAGIRLGQFIAADMIAVRLTPPLPLAVVASPDYLQRQGRPECLEDLNEHACLRLRRSNGMLAPWQFLVGDSQIDVGVSGPLIAHDYPTLLGAALKGAGLAQIPRPVVQAALNDESLVQVLEPFASTTPGLFLFYPSRNHVMPKLRAFIDHIKCVLR